MNRGSIAIGTLLLFIAALLVVTGGAFVLLSTQQQFMEQFRSSATEGQKSVLTRLDISNLAAQKSDDDPARLEWFFLTGQFSADAPPMPVDQLQVQFTTESSSSVLDYNAPAANSPADCMQAAVGERVFGVRFLNHGIENAVKPGDKIELCMWSAEGIVGNTKLLIRVLPKNGTPTVLETTTPRVFDRDTLSLYP